jgi:hypothetical protein
LSFFSHASESGLPLFVAHVPEVLPVSAESKLASGVFGQTVDLLSLLLGKPKFFLNIGSLDNTQRTGSAAEPAEPAGSSKAARAALSLSVNRRAHHGYGHNDDGKPS